MAGDHTSGATVKGLHFDPNNWMELGQWALGQPNFFFEITPQTPQWSLGQNVPGNQFSANSEVVWPRLQGSEGPQVGLILTHLGSFGASEGWSNTVRIGWKLMSRQDLAQTSLWSLRRFSKKYLGRPIPHAHYLFCIHFLSFAMRSTASFSPQYRDLKHLWILLHCFE